MSSSSNQDLLKANSLTTTSITHVIENYQNASSKTFPSFKLFSNDKIEFALSCHPNRECKFYSASYTIILLSFKPQIGTVQATVRYHISLKNSNSDECWSQDGIADVSNKTPNDSYFGHYQILRSKILDPANGLLVDDKLTVYCEIEEFDYNNVPKLYKNPVLENYQCLLENAKFSDAVLIIGENELPVHKAILGAQSKVFAAMFENDCKEKRHNRVEIIDVSVEVAKLMLRYIYTGFIDELTDEYVADLFIAADKYQLDYLKEECEEHLSTSIDTKTVANTLLVADMYNASLLKTQCIEYVIEHGKEVIASEGWKVLTKARPELVIQLFERIYNEK